VTRFIPRFLLDSYVITAGMGEMIAGGKIANRQNLMDKDGPVPGEYRGWPIIAVRNKKVKALAEILAKGYPFRDAKEHCQSS
jgi:hypothetical protein